ncbi:MAG TPA: HDIG domain-containing protein [Gemmatimonadales bacterium]|nr:HDIG domain-containing protein [Gemmatimonadales bacterium]
MTHPVVFHAVRWAMLLGLAVLTYRLYPTARGLAVPLVRPGEVAPRDVVAPFGFAVPKDAAEIEREANALAATVRPIYEYRGDAVDSVVAHADRLFRALEHAATPEALVDSARAHGVRLSPEEAAYLRGDGRLAAFRTATTRFFRRELPRGIPASGTVEIEVAPDVLIRRDGGEQVVSRDSVMVFERLLRRRAAFHPAPQSATGDQTYVKVLHGLFQPTLVPNVRETEARRADLRASVDSIKGRVQANERIVAAHDVVSPDVYQRLLALRRELVRRGESDGTLSASLGHILGNAIILSIFWLLLLIYRGSVYADLRQMVALTIIFGLTIAGAAVNRSVLSDSAELIPLPFAGILIAMLISGRVALIAALVLAFLLGAQPIYGGPAALYTAAVGGVASAMAVRPIRRRSQLLWAMLVVTLALGVALTSLALRNAISTDDLPTTMLRAAVNGVGSTALAAIALPVFEAFTGITTNLTLLELSDPDRPLLRRLATEAPGTYAHSLAMANLCEAACNAIGANGLLARVGCYYHDIGKVHRPQYFVENTGPGGNPHDRLPPQQSAEIIRSHVSDGLALADEHRLPAAVRAFIPEHHGTSEITYFLERARASGGVPAPDGTYRYPGPRPRSVETAVALLADGVEAAIRVLDEPTDERVAEAIDHLFEQRIASGQLAEAPLTLAQLDRVRDVFRRVLGGMYHGRVDYPASGGGISGDWKAPASA